MSIPCQYCSGTATNHKDYCAVTRGAHQTLKAPSLMSQLGLIPPLTQQAIAASLAPAVTKPTNPKDRIGSSKLPVSLVPDTVSILAAQAFAEGASKYGAYNWRAAGVRLSIYMEAMRRHQMKLWNGEWADKKTKVPHLASIIACCGIIEDARACGKLTDDRPPVLDVEPLIEAAEAVIQHVMAMNAHMSPHHCTINDPVAKA